jgi:hypothetical protein
VRPKPLIAISANTFAGPANSKADRKSTGFTDTLSCKCSAQIQKTPFNISVADSVFGSSHDPFYSFLR